MGTGRRYKDLQSTKGGHDPSQIHSGGRGVSGSVPEEIISKLRAEASGEELGEGVPRKSVPGQTAPERSRAKRVLFEGS